MTPQATYVPIAVPVELGPEHPGRTQGIIGIICAVVSLVVLPPFFGVAGIVLGILALKKGQRNLGLIAIILSAVFMVIGGIIGVVVSSALDESGGFILGSILSFTP